MIRNVILVAIGAIGSALFTAAIWRRTRNGK
jgi:hypothetical protein